ncbi:MAG: metalloregulator ArsR/SmtB family transcription factor [Victivallales bacterium]|nr:metalloregulator ArsR/SmtB family transcription factor [Victivallales bacterium]
MAVFNRKLIDEKAKVFKALGHPTRLLLVEKLAAGECCVCELVALAGVDFSTVSRHLSLLKEAGIIRDEKRGQKVFYRLELPCVIRFDSCVEAALQAQLEAKIARRQ